MNNVAHLILIAAIGGLAVAFQGQFMGLLDRNIGTSESVLFNYFSGTVVAGLVIMVLHLQGASFNLKAWTEVPWYVFSAGLLGIIIVGSVSYTVPRLGLSVAFTIIVASQFITAMILEHYGWFGGTANPIDLSRLMGVSSIILGVWLITH